MSYRSLSLHLQPCTNHSTYLENFLLGRDAHNPLVLRHHFRGISALESRQHRMKEGKRWSQTNFYDAGSSRIRPLFEGMQCFITNDEAMIQCINILHRVQATLESEAARPPLPAAAAPPVRRRQVGVRPARRRPLPRWRRGGDLRGRHRRRGHHGRPRRRAEAGHRRRRRQVQRQLGRGRQCCQVGTPQVCRTEFKTLYFCRG